MTWECRFIAKGAPPASWGESLSGFLRPSEKLRRDSDLYFIGATSLIDARLSLTRRTLELKRLQDETSDGCQLWTTELAATADSEAAWAKLCLAIGVRLPTPPLAKGLSAADYRAAFARTAIRCLVVDKDRWLFENDTMCAEVVDLQIDGRRFASVAAASDRLSSLKKLHGLLDLDPKLEATDYVGFLRRRR